MFTPLKLFWLISSNVISISAVDGTIENAITLEYKNLELNQKLNFPYTIPKGYQEIALE